MTDYLIKNWKVIEKGGYDGAVFLFDEFHTIRDSNGKRFVLANFIGALDEAQKGYRYAAVLCGLPILQNNLKEARPYSERTFKSLQVSMLKESDAKRAMAKPLEGTKRKFSSALLSEIAEDTNCYPYFVQFYAKEILDRVDKDSIGVEDYRKVRCAIVDFLDRDFFDQRMEQLNNSQRAALYAMAGVQDADITFAAVKKLASIKGTFTKNLARLEEKGHIHKARHGVYRFSLPPCFGSICGGKDRSVQGPSASARHGKPCLESAESAKRRIGPEKGWSGTGGPRSSAYPRIWIGCGHAARRDG